MSVSPKYCNTDTNYDSLCDVSLECHPALK